MEDQFTNQIKQLAEAMGKRVIILNDRSSFLGSSKLILSKTNDPEVVIIGTHNNAACKSMSRIVFAADGSVILTGSQATHMFFCGDDYVTVSVGQIEPIRHLLRGPIEEECEVCFERCLRRTPCLNCGIGVCIKCFAKIKAERG